MLYGVITYMERCFDSYWKKGKKKKKKKERKGTKKKMIGYGWQWHVKSYYYSTLFKSWQKDTHKNMGYGSDFQNILITLDTFECRVCRNLSNRQNQRVN